jgi:hypothetical protein
LYDSLKRERVDIEFFNRSFTSFGQLAQEIADSRLSGRIHSPQDNIEGLKFGRAVGKNISQLGWKR